MIRRTWAGLVWSHCQWQARRHGYRIAWCARHGTVTLEARRGRMTPPHAASIIARDRRVIVRAVDAGRVLWP